MDRDELHQQDEATTENDKSNENPKEPQRLPILHAELKLPEGMIGRYDANQKQAQRKGKIRFWVELSTLIVIAGALIFTGLQW